MFWDRFAFVYDLFENAYNGKVNKEVPRIVAELISPSDEVLECACGTGMFSLQIAPRCKSLTATDFSSNMLSKAKKKLSRAGITNTTFEFADITALKYEDNSFDKIVAGNVIHLLDDPLSAMKEFERIVRPGGMIIIPTYLTYSEQSKGAANFLNKLGANFRQRFDMGSYRKFFGDMGYTDVQYRVAKGRMPCCVAIIRR